MKQMSNWDKVQTISQRPALPVGAYICKIVGAKVKQYDGQNGSFERLEIVLDIADGEYKDFYKNDFAAQTGEDKKWKGVLRLYVPTDDGSEQDEWTQRRLKTAMVAIEDSNKGYQWDWDETKLKDKMVGCIFRNEQWVWEGKSGWKAQPFAFLSVDDVKNGKFTLPNDKPHKDAGTVSMKSPDVDFEEVPLPSDDDLPF